MEFLGGVCSASRTCSGFEHSAQMLSANANNSAQNAARND
jgi:hypothetical protein